MLNRQFRSIYWFIWSIWLAWYCSSAVMLRISSSKATLKVKISSNRVDALNRKFSYLPLLKTVKIHQKARLATGKCHLSWNCTLFPSFVRLAEGERLKMFQLFSATKLQPFERIANFLKPTKIFLQTHEIFAWPFLMIDLDNDEKVSYWDIRKYNKLISCLSFILWNLHLHIKLAIVRSLATKEMKNIIYESRKGTEG